MTEELYRSVFQEPPKDNQDKHMPPQAGVELWLPYQESQAKQISKEYFSDYEWLNDEENASMTQAFNDGMLSVQVDHHGKAYFNPEGIVTFGDLLQWYDLATPTPKQLIEPTDHHVATESDFFYHGYCKLLTYQPKVAKEMTRSTCFLAVTVQTLMVFILKCLVLNAIGATAENLVTHFVYEDILATTDGDALITRLQLAQIFNEWKALPQSPKGDGTHD